MSVVTCYAVIENEHRGSFLSQYLVTGFLLIMNFFDAFRHKIYKRTHFLWLSDLQDYVV